MPYIMLTRWERISKNVLQSEASQPFGGVLPDSEEVVGVPLEGHSRLE